MDLFQTHVYLSQKQDLVEQYQYCNDRSNTAKKFIGKQLLFWAKIIKFIIPICCLIYLCISYFNDWRHSYKPTLFGFLDIIFVPICYAGLLFLAISLIYFLLWSILKIIHSMRKLTSHEIQEIDKCINLQRDIQCKLDILNSELEQSEIPIKYRYYEAVEWMVNAYNNNRGTTYSELINLFEHELQMVEHKNAYETLKLQNIQQSLVLDEANSKIIALKNEAKRMDKALKTTKRSADAAWWSAHLK